MLGAGSWGTALALQFARCGRQVRLWGRNPEDLAIIVADRENKRYLPGVAFPENLSAEPDLAACVGGVTDILVAVPSHGLRETLHLIVELLSPDVRICWATKGFELSTGKLPHQVAEEVLGDQRAMAVLSGPTFAKEVGMGLPTAMTVAANNEGFARGLANELSCESFRAYTSTDMLGVEIGGAIKNVLAIAAGLSDGLGFGANTRIALITRGLVEMTRLGVAFGAKQETFMGLAGMGDLVLTCTDDLSRNRRMGLALARGLTVETAQEEIQQAVEGVLAAKAVREVAESEQVEMPICGVVYGILYEGVAPMDAVASLMSRAITSE